MQTADHGGWIMMNGRAKATLTATQQAALTTLGLASVPDARNRYMKDGNGTAGSTGGSADYYITQAQLPNVNFYHNHIYDKWTSAYKRNMAEGFGNTYSVLDVGGANGTSGAYDSYTSIYLNGGQTQQVMTIQPQFFTTNTFLYLGA